MHTFLFLRHILAFPLPPSPFTPTRPVVAFASPSLHPDTSARIWDMLTKVQGESVQLGRKIGTCEECGDSAREHRRSARECGGSVRGSARERARECEGVRGSAREHGERKGMRGEREGM